MWDKLDITQKSEIIKQAVQLGITSIPEIKLWYQEQLNQQAEQQQQQQMQAQMQQEQMAQQQEMPQQFAKGGHLFGPVGEEEPTQQLSNAGGQFLDTWQPSDNRLTIEEQPVLETVNPYYRTYHFEPFDNFRVYPAEGQSYLPNVTSYNTGQSMKSGDFVWVKDGINFPANANDINTQRDWYLNHGNLNVNIPLPEVTKWGVPTSDRARFIANANRLKENELRLQQLDALSSPAVRDALGISEQQIFENQDDANWYPDRIDVQRAKDIRRNKQFNRDLANIAALHIAAPVLGTTLGIGAATAPIATMAGTALGTYGSYLWNKRFPNYEKEISGLLQGSLGLTPEISNTIAMFANPGALIGGVGGTYAANNPATMGRLSAKVGDAFAPNISRRLAETAMRVDAKSNPLSEIFQSLRNSPKEKTLKRLKYILTGNDSGDVTNRTLSEAAGGGRYRVYRGSLDEDSMLVKAGTSKDWNDVIDAYLYNKKMDENYGTLINVGNPSEFGIHSNYIAQNYANKANKIPVYEVSNPVIDWITAKYMRPGEVKGVEGMIRGLGNNFGKDAVDVAGHLLHRLNVPEHLLYQAQDIWKFLPEDYSKKWDITDWLGKFGMGFIDGLGTPIITRTPVVNLDTELRSFANGGHLFDGDTESNQMMRTQWQNTHSTQELRDIAEQNKWMAQDSLRRDLAEPGAIKTATWLNKISGYGIDTSLFPQARNNYAVSAYLMDNALGAVTGHIGPRSWHSPKESNETFLNENKYENRVDPMDVYLTSRYLQEKALLNSGYKRIGNNYGLVRKAVGNRKLPVYQEDPDEISRDSLFAIGNIYGYLPNIRKPSNNPGSINGTIYVDKYGHGYTNTWDLHDYGFGEAGNSRGSTTDNYFGINPGSLLDSIGNPTVFVSGIRRDPSLDLDNYPNFTDVIWDGDSINIVANVDSLKRELSKNGEIDVTNDKYNPSGKRAFIKALQKKPRKKLTVQEKRTLNKVDQPASSTYVNQQPAIKLFKR